MNDQDSAFLVGQLFRGTHHKKCAIGVKQTADQTGKSEIENE
jgi:hypothetical protein